MCLFHVHVYVFYDFTFIVLYDYFLCVNVRLSYVFLNKLTYLLT